MTFNRQPTCIIRDGELSATIWCNSGKECNLYSVRFTRTWRDADGIRHKDTTFGGPDLLRIAHLATQAYEHFSMLRLGVDPAEEWHVEPHKPWELAA